MCKSSTVVKSSVFKNTDNLTKWLKENYHGCSGHFQTKSLIERELHPELKLEIELTY